MNDAPGLLSGRWFASRGWQPFPFQREVWQAVDQGESGLLHATTGSGKTYAVWLGALDRFASVGAGLPANRVTGPLRTRTPAIDRLVASKAC